MNLVGTELLVAALERASEKGQSIHTVVLRLAHRAHVGFSLLHFTLDTAHSRQLPRSFRPVKPEAWAGAGPDFKLLTSAMIGIDRNGALRYQKDSRLCWEVFRSLDPFICDASLRIKYVYVDNSPVRLSYPYAEMYGMCRFGLFYTTNIV